MVWLLAMYYTLQGVIGAGRRLLIPPSEIGKITAKTEVKQLLLSHRMKRTIGKEPQTLVQIRQTYQGVIEFADVLQCAAHLKLNEFCYKWVSICPTCLILCLYFHLCFLCYSVSTSRIVEFITMAVDL